MGGARCWPRSTQRERSLFFRLLFRHWPPSLPEGTAHAQPTHTHPATGRRLESVALAPAPGEVTRGRALPHTHTRTQTRCVRRCVCRLLLLSACVCAYRRRTSSRIELLEIDPRRTKQTNKQTKQRRGRRETLFFVWRFANVPWKRRRDWIRQP